MSESRSETIRVSRDQITAARALIELRGADNVAPWVRKLAAVPSAAAERQTPHA